MTIDTAFQRYYEEKSQHGAAPKDDVTRLATVAEFLGPNLLFHEINDDRIALMVAKLRARKNRAGQLLANGTVNRYTECLRRAWRRAAKIWKIECGDEPSWGHHLLEEPSERVRDLTADEEAALFANLRADFHPMVRFALMSGMRLANVRKLTWREVDFDARAVTVKMKSKKPGGRTHTVPLTAPMVDLLRSEHGHHPIYVFTYECAKSRVKRKKGERYPYTRDGWRKAWLDALEKAGIEDFRFHDTRHTAATRTLRVGGNLKVVQKMLGHTDITTTARYAHAIADDVRAAMEQAQSRTIPSKGLGKAKKAL